jgi:hypothetical protein
VGKTDPTGTYDYDPAKALKYAKNWANGRNTDSYPDHGYSDCTNFVSQCLCAGGWPKCGTDGSSDSSWFCRKTGNGSFSVSLSWVYTNHWNNSP